MPEILVTTTPAEGVEGAVLLRERVSLSDFDSDHFCGQLVERVGWAVVDADGLERQLAAAGRPARPRQVRRAGTREDRPRLHAAA